ncbi:hypothetical protein G3R49_09995 [Shewanella sp. WXL01]|uniref:TolB family protein n=1 Tax=Shewanella sp. WXL01 TaxID=2709721 RepID=UPI0014382CEB|nr:PD40 domain-containing protein [Shewanella sp. WXL01]NKF50891.1 hypothetical protein [Shewanella sp. WXL01]
MTDIHHKASTQLKSKLTFAATLLLTGSALISSQIACAADTTNIKKASKAPYYNPAAYDKAVEFAPGIISTQAHFEINTVFNKTGDKVLFARCSDDFSRCTMMESDYKNGQWQTPKALPFSGKYLEADPYYNADYSQVYFVSKRPINQGEALAETVNIWRTKLIVSADGVSGDSGSGDSSSWEAPEYLAELSSNADDLYPSITDSGDLYFPSFRDNRRTMYVAKKQGENSFAKPVALDEAIFGKNASIGDSMVSRDGTVMLLSIKGRADSLGKGDLYIARKVNGEWTKAKSLGDKVNTANHEFTPIISPDGKYLFFTRVENGRGNLYQIHLNALDNVE